MSTHRQQTRSTSAVAPATQRHNTLSLHSLKHRAHWAGLSCLLLVTVAGATCDVDVMDPAFDTNISLGQTNPSGASTVPAAGQILAQSTFDIDYEGWSIWGNGERSMPEWEATDDGGCITQKFNVSAPIAYWDAPDKVLGDLSQAYGGVLTFKTFIKRSSKKTAKLIMLTGPNGLVLDLDMPFNPNSGWTTFSVRLDDSTAWKNADTQLAATQAELREVLSDLVQLRIRAEYPADYVRPLGKLDDVILRLP